MAGKQQPWLISYKYQAVFARTDDGGTSRVGPTETIGIVDKPPWKFLADSLAEARKYSMKPYPKNGTRLADEILVIYWAVQLPIGALTDEEMDLLS